MKRYFASEPGQPKDVLYTHIEFTLLIEYNPNKSTETRGKPRNRCTLNCYTLEISEMGHV